MRPWRPERLSPGSSAGLYRPEQNQGELRWFAALLVHLQPLALLLRRSSSPKVAGGLKVGRLKLPSGLRYRPAYQSGQTNRLALWGSAMPPAEAPVWASNSRVALPAAPARSCRAVQTSDAFPLSCPSTCRPPVRLRRVWTRNRIRPWPVAWAAELHLASLRHVSTRL